MIELTPIEEFDRSQPMGRFQVLVEAHWDSCGAFESAGIGAKLKPTHFVKKASLADKFQERCKTLSWALCEEFEQMSKEHWGIHD